MSLNIHGNPHEQQGVLGIAGPMGGGISALVSSDWQSCRQEPFISPAS